MTSTTEAPATGLSALLRAKAQLHRDMTALQSAVDDPPLFAEIEHRLIRRFTDDYQPGLDDLIASSDPANIAERCDQLGAQLADDLATTGDTTEFKTRLLEFEVLSDALLMLASLNERQRPLPMFLDRIATYRMAVANEPSPALAHAREAQP